MAKIDVLIPDGYKPARKEKDAAWVLARFYKTTVEMLRPSARYRERTPDFKINGKPYELKTPETSQARKILTLISEASDQAERVVIDIRWTKVIEKRMLDLACEALLVKQNKRIIKIVVIASRKKVLEITR
ncbi:MAG: hypothetical protein LBM12_01130 [Candidatus Nomurabacteria bacterium]|jgi:hypothetical protein|nr:hypothetical protein [Candidatus Nomurabacteria bacterium]